MPYSGITCLLAGTVLGAGALAFVLLVLDVCCRRRRHLNEDEHEAAYNHTWQRDDE